MRRSRPSYGGVIGAIVLFCLSLTPSLLPRTTLLQGLLSGICMAIGYAIGVAAGALVHRFWTPPRAGRRAWTVLAGTGLVPAAVFLYLGSGWQRELRALTGMERDWQPVLIGLLAIAAGGLLVLAGRAIRVAVGSAPRPAASVAGVTALALLIPGLGPQLGQSIAAPLLLVADRYFAGAEAPGIAQPTSPYVSGGPGSLVPWETLGGKGREFVAGATGDAIRIYVGRDTAPSLADRARLAVRELRRTGGFDRSVIAIVVVTGSGGVNPGVVAELERRHQRDTAVVTIQYSYLPSWISFLTDRSLVTQSARALIDAVHAAMPSGDRPTLLVYGESLGAYGIERAYPSADQLLARVDAAVLAGPPHGPMWRANDRLRYLNNASDPVARWNLDLLYQPPAWPDRAPGAMRWLPVVSFWQVTVDMLAAIGVPAGHGHSYGPPLADPWRALPPAAVK
jgi:uncharacterized membrane protein